MLFLQAGPVSSSTAPPGTASSRDSRCVLTSYIWYLCIHVCITYQPTPIATLELNTCKYTSQDGSPQACLAPNEWAKTNAGVTLARCLAALGVEATSTRGFDNLERFHVYGPCRTAEGDVDDWFVQYHPGDGVAGAAGCCVPETVSWHYVGPMEARALASVLYGGKGRARCVVVFFYVCYVCVLPA